MNEHTKTSEFALPVDGGPHDPLEDEVRRRVRGFIETILEEELEAALGRGRYQRSAESKRGQRNGHRDRQVIGTFGPETVKVPRARLVGDDGRTSEWRSKSLRRYQRLTKKAEALIASVYLAGTNTRRVKRALFGLFDGAVSKDIVSRAWRKVKTDWEVWCTRDLADEDVVRLILDGTVVKARIDRKATAISVLAAIGVRRDGQKVLLSIRNMGGESKAAGQGAFQPKATDTVPNGPKSASKRLPGGASTSTTSSRSRRVRLCATTQVPARSTGVRSAMS